MAVVEKSVFFIGVWRTSAVTDQLLRQISGQTKSKKGFATTLHLSAKGLELCILNTDGHVTRTDKIPLENIVDCIDNRYMNTCILAIVKDKDHYNVFGFGCGSERDAADMVQGFGQMKKKLSGEGFNTDLKPTEGLNWVLQPKQESEQYHAENGGVRIITTTEEHNGVRVLHSGESQIQQQGEVYVMDNGAYQNGGVRVITGEPQQSHVRVVQTTSSDNMSHSSDKAEMQDELHHLADEVRDIKLLLRKSQGRAQFEKHYGYRINPPKPTQTMVTQEVEQTVTPQPTSYKLRETRSQTVHVNNRQINEPQVVVLRSSGNSRPQMRPKSAHYVSSSSISSETPSGYTKRVYDSPNPSLDRGMQLRGDMMQHQGYVRVIPKQRRRIMIPTNRMHLSRSHSSDIVQKNIEDVYKSRSLKRHVVPVPVSPSYVNANYAESFQTSQRSPVETHSPVQFTPPRTSPAIVQKHVRQNVQHVRYEPEIRGYYENEEQIRATEDENVSKIVNVATYENLEDTNIQYDENLFEMKENGRHVEDIHQTSRPTHEQSENVTVIRATNSDYLQREPQHHSSRDEVNVIRVTSNGTEGYTQHQVPSRVVGGGVVGGGVIGGGDVYHVTMGGVKHSSNGNIVDDAVVTETVRTTSERYDGGEGTVLGSDRVFEVTQENEGLFGYDTKYPDFENASRVVVKETAYRYHDDTAEDDSKVSSRASSTDGTTDTEAREGKRVHYMENIEQTIVDKVESDNESDKNGDDDHHNGDNDDHNGDNGNHNGDNGDHNGDDLNNNGNNKDSDNEDEPYVINKDEVKHFQQGPTVIIVDTEEEGVIHTKDDFKDFRDELKERVHERDELKEIIHDAEDTVLF